MSDKTDRRVRKTKATIRAGLMTLMQSKSIKEITIKELVDEVDINRSTFYLHYTDIYQLLKSIEEELLEEIIHVIDTHPLLLSTENTLTFIEDIFLILDRNRDICCTLMGPNGDISFFRKMEQIIEEKGLEVLTPMFPSDLDDLKYSYSFCLSGCMGLMKTWLLGKTNESSEHMSKLTSQMITSAMYTFYNNRHS